MNRQKPDASVVNVDRNGFVYVDGVQLGRLTGDGKSIVVADRDKKRSQARGSRFVTVPISELENLTKK